MPNYNDSIIGGNPFDMRRFGNIFGGQGAQRQPLLPQDSFMQAIQRVQPTPPTQPAQGQDPLMSALARLQGGQATSAYREHVGNIPNPQDYAPSKWRRLGGALAAAGAAYNRNPNAGEIGASIRDAPLRGAVQNWQMKGAGLKEQADLEAQDITGQIKYIQAIRQQENEDRKYRLEVGNQEIADLNARTNATYRSDQTKIAIQRMENAGWQRMIGANGNVVMFNPITQEQIDMGPSIETPRLANEQARIGISRGQLGVAQGQLGIAGRNADTNAIRAGIYGQSVADRRSGLGNVGFVSPNAQIAADALAVKNVIDNNPGFAQWVDEEGVVIPPSADQLNDPKYQRFKKALAAEQKRILGMRQQRPGTTGTIPRLEDLED
jgi:hypothetical protein